jgi:isocitrate dehydrogenase (NAD+)
MLLEHVGRGDAGARIERAVMKTLEAGIGLTGDLHGTGTTNTLTEQVIKNLGA